MRTLVRIQPPPPYLLDNNRKSAISPTAKHDEVGRILGVADAAAFSGTAQLVQGREITIIKTAARNAAVETGFVLTRGETQTIVSPPANGVFAADSNVVEVILEDNLPRLFICIFF